MAVKSYIKDYPRPQLVRPAWENLNGNWDFAFDDGDAGIGAGWFRGFEPQKQIRVPFTYETELSGIHDETRHDHVWYQKKVRLTPETGKKVLLHFEGSDYLTSVWINGVYAGNHKGGYARFTFDITPWIREGENLIVVKADDSFSEEQARGKQRWRKENFACWYVQTTGIWKTVWLETVPDVYVSSLKLTPDVKNGEIDIEALVAGAEDVQAAPGQGKELMLQAEISFADESVAKASVQVHDGKASLKVSVSHSADFGRNIRLWSPRDPALYDLKVSLTADGKPEDEVLSYFGMRDIRIEKGNVLLNGAPLYQRLILDQGYWKDSGITAPDEEALIEDIDKIQKLGFNGVRKHMKVEDERFLYWADVKGLLVWSEMAAFYEFTDNAVQEYTAEWMEVVRQNYSHPAIITWTPFNESWGVPQIKTDEKQQHFTEAIYYLTKSFDSMRPVITNDGWEHTISDIITLHDYEEDGETFLERYLNHKDELMDDEIFHSGFKSAIADGYSYHGQPVIISEYGGIAFSKRGEGEWGYGNGVKDEEAFVKRYDRITTAIRSVPWIVGFCYTQVSDVQQEVNGLMTMERNFKVTPEKISAVNTKKTPFHA